MKKLPQTPFNHRLSALLFYTLVTCTTSVNANVELPETNPHHNLNFKGQGMSNWCFAFSEEQALKDLTCGNNCQLNANEWKFSIFDILRLHSRSDEKIFFDTKEEKQIFSYSPVNFPYFFAETSIKFRHAKCTLEEDFFRLFRDTNYNTSNLIITDFFVKLYRDLRVLSPQQKSQVFANYPNEFIQSISQLATKNQSLHGFQKDVFNFSKCDQLLNISNIKFSFSIETTKESLQQKVSELLTQNSPILLGVCAETLQQFKNHKAMSCLGHSINIKQESETHYLVVDSRFNSQVEKLPDGSHWVKKETVLEATVKHGHAIISGKESIKRQQEEVRRKYAQISSLSFKTNALDQTRTQLEQQVFQFKNLPAKQRKNFYKQVVSSYDTKDPNQIRLKKETLQLITNSSFIEDKDYYVLIDYLLAINEVDIDKRITSLKNKFRFQIQTNPLEKTGNLVWITQ